MKQTHPIPEIYNPNVPYSVKCEILVKLCQALARHKRMNTLQLRCYLLEKVHVDFEKLENNPIGMLLLYEYIHSQRPEACSISSEKPQN